MPVDARIPLQVENRNFAQPLLDLAEKQRVDSVTQSNLKSANQQQTLNAQSIEKGQRSLDANSMVAIVNDMEAMKRLLEQGQIKSAGQVGFGIRKRLVESGEGVEGFDEIMANMKADPEAAIEYFTTAGKAMAPQMQSLMYAAGQAPKPEEKPQMVNAGNLTDTGQAVFQNPDGSVSAQEVGGLTQPPLEVDFDNASDQAALRVRATGGTVGEGRFEMSPDRLSDVNALTPEQAEAQLRVGKLGRTPSDQPYNNAEDVKLNEGLKFTQNLVNTLSDVKTLIQSDPLAQSFGGQVASFMENFKADAKGTAAAIGVEFDESLFQLSNYNEEFKKMAVTDARLQSAYTAAAYSLAAAQNAGRVSESDFKKALVQVGGNLSDPTSAVAVLDDVLARETRSFRDNYFNVTGSEFTGQFGPKSAGTTGAANADSLTAEIDALRAELGL